MGKKDSASKKYFSDSERFADLINGICFEGRQILKGENLTEIDSHVGNRTRDVAKKALFGTTFVILGEENQETVDYSLPVRIMESDVEDYKKEVSEIQKEMRKKLKRNDSSNLGSSGERLYLYPKNARISPVITFVLSNAENWDGPRGLRDMLKLEELPEDLLPYIIDYRLNIVEIPKLTDEEMKRFRTDLRQVMMFLRYLRDKEKLKCLLEEDISYQNIDQDAYNLMKEYARLEKYSLNDKHTEGGNQNMRTAFDEVWEEGVERGRDEGIAIFIQDKIEDGVDRGIIRERLIKKFSLPEDKADQYLDAGFNVS